MTALYQNTKVVEAAKDWRVTDKAETAAPPAQKEQARKEHRFNKQKLRAAVDELAKKGGAA